MGGEGVGVRKSIGVFCTTAGPKSELRFLPKMTQLGGSSSGHEPIVRCGSTELGKAVARSVVSIISHISLLVHHCCMPAAIAKFDVQLENTIAQ